MASIAHMPVVLGPCPRCKPHGSASLMASFPYFFVILTPPSYYCSFLTETSSAASQDKQQHTRHLWGVPLPRSRHTLPSCFSRAPCLWMRTWVCHSCADSLSSASPLVFPVLPRHTHSAAPLPWDSQLLKAPGLLIIWHLILISLFMQLLQDSTYCPLEWLLLWAGLLVTMQFSFLLPHLLPWLHSDSSITGTARLWHFTLKWLWLTLARHVPPTCSGSCVQEDYLSPCVLEQPGQHRSQLSSNRKFNMWSTKKLKTS